MTALHLAARWKSSVPVATLLLLAGADPNKIDGGQRSPLHSAALYNPQIIETLVKHKAEVNLLDNDNKSPLFYAALNNHTDAVVALCKAGGDPRLGESPLTSFRVREDVKEIIKKYL